MLTVAICTYRNALLLRGCLQAILSQPLPNELDVVLVVNNGGDAEVSGVVCEMQTELVRLVEVVEPVLGLTAARRRAVMESASEFVAFVDDDVRLNATWISNLVEFLKRRPDVGVVGGQIQLQWEATPTKLALRCSHLLCELSYGEHEVRLPVHGRMHLPGAALVVRRPSLIGAGWIARQYLSDRAGKSLSSGGDTEMILRVASGGGAVWYAPSLIAQHFVPSERMSREYLCRLAYGIARADSQLWAISGDSGSVVTRVARVISKGAYLLRRWAAWLWHDVFTSCPGEGFRRVQVSEAAGSFISAVAELCRGTRRSA